MASVSSRFAFVIIAFAMLAATATAKQKYCGPLYGGKVCPDDYCCSKAGHCGTGSAYCKVKHGCQAAFGMCYETAAEASASPAAVAPQSAPEGGFLPGQCGGAAGSCPDGLCCSKWGWCGTTKAYCGKGCQSEYGSCKSAKSVSSTRSVTKSTSITKSVSKSRSATKSISKSRSSTKSTSLSRSSSKSISATRTPAADKSPAEFSMSPSHIPASASAVASIVATVSAVPPSPSHIPTPTPSYLTQCGVAANGASCLPGYCCSQWGYCGTSAAYCDVGCQIGYGNCDASPSPTSSPGSASRTPSITSTISVTSSKSVPPSASKSIGSTASPSPSASLGSGSFSGYPTTTCGNGVCENPWLPTGETCGNCPDDCGPCQVSANVMKCVENNKIALTFDDGPSQGVTQSVMSSLAAANVKATFFVVGSMVDQTPSLLAAEVAAGHSTVSHSYSHPSLTSLSQAEVYQEMFKTETAFGNAGVCRRPTLMRPPYGDINSNLDKFLRRMGYRAMIWNLDTMDWQDAQSNPNLVVSNFKTNFNNLMPSGILSLQHDLFQYTADIVPSILSFIQTKSYEFVSVERCVWGPNYQRHPSWVHMHRMCDQAVANWPAVTPSESCPVSDWSDWSDCDVSCGPGTQTRVRLTMPPSLAQTSAACGSVPLIESRACSGQAACSSSCTYNAWTNWGACSKSCGGGTQIQTRTVKSGGSSCGAVLQTQVCNTQACVSSPARRALRGE